MKEVSFRLRTIFELEDHELEKAFKAIHAEGDLIHYCELATSLDFIKMCDTLGLQNTTEDFRTWNYGEYSTNSPAFNETLEGTLRQQFKEYFECKHPKAILAVMAKQGYQAEFTDSVALWSMR